MEQNGLMVIDWDAVTKPSILHEAAARMTGASMEWRLFPTIFVSGDFLNFKYAAREDEEAAPEFNSAFHEHQFVAVRGIPLFFKFGYQLYDGKQKKLICRTTKAVYDTGVERNDMFCLDYPMGRTLYRSKAKPTELTPFFRDTSIQLYGSRPLVEDPNSPERRTCRDCVFAGEALQVQGEVVNSCSLRGEIIFAVTEVGRYKVDPVEMTQVLEWTELENIPQKSLTSPYIVKIPISSSSMYGRIGTGEYDYPVRTQPAKNCPVPGDVKTLGEYWEWIMKRLNTLAGPTLPNGRPVLLTPTEVYNGKLSTPKNSIESMLVARYRSDLSKQEVRQLAERAWQKYTLMTSENEIDFYTPEETQEAMKVISRKGK